MYLFYLNCIGYVSIVGCYGECDSEQDADNTPYCNRTHMHSWLYKLLVSCVFSLPRGFFKMLLLTAFAIFATNATKPPVEYAADSGNIQVGYYCMHFGFFFLKTFTFV